MKLNFTSTRVWIAICLACFAIPGTLQARAPEQGELDAARVLGDDIADWLASLSNRPASLGIFSLHANAPLDSEYSSILQPEILRGLTARRFENVVPCPECHVPQATVEDGQLVISKGVAEPSTLARMSKLHPVESFLVVEIFRTTLTVTAQATLYGIPNGTLLAAERFSVPTLNFNDSSVQVLLTFGVGNVSPTPVGSSALATSGTLSLLEELGFAKGGLTLGAVMGTNSLIHLDPTLAFRGRFGRSGMTWSFNLGAGFGFLGGGKGLVFRGAYELYFGFLATLGVEVNHYLPQDSATGTQQTYYGLHVGLSFGR